MVERATALERQLKLVTADRAKLQAAVAMATASASAADARLTELKVAYTVRAFVAHLDASKALLVGTTRATLSALTSSF